MSLRCVAIVLLHLDVIWTGMEKRYSSILQHVGFVHVNLGWFMGCPQAGVTHDDPAQVKPLCIGSVVWPFDLFTHLVHSENVSSLGARG